MAAALGINQALMFTGVFALGSLLAGLAGALALPREPANLAMDLTIIADVFVVTVVGGLGSLPGAYVAAVIISVVKAWCIGLGDAHIFGVAFSFSKLTLVAEFIVMAVVLVIRPWGLFGTPQAPQRIAAASILPLPVPDLRRAWPLAAVMLVLIALPLVVDRYSVVLATDIVIFALFAASLGLIMGAGGMASFGHAAYFGAGAYAAAVAAHAGAPFLLAVPAGVAFAGGLAVVFGWFCVRLSGVSLAMLTLAFAQITWAIAYQWDSVTGGSNGLIGVWPPAALSGKTAYYFATLVLAGIAILLVLAHRPRAARLSAPGRARLPRPRRGGRRRRAPRPVARHRRGRRGSRARGRALRILERLAVAGLTVNSALRRRARDGADRRRANTRRPRRRRIRVRHAAGLDRARDALLARGPRRDADPHHRPFPARHRRHASAVARATGGHAMTASSTAPVLAVDGIGKSFKGFRAVDRISFTLYAGELLALIGPNGAGKTTTFNMINGQLTPDHGRVLLEGRDVTGQPPRALWRSGVARTFQITQTFASMTVAENLLVAILSRERARGLLTDVAAAYTDEVRTRLAEVDMPYAADTLCSVLAYGDLKRVELAIALVNDPRLLLMDEPTAGMAARERGALMRLVADRARQRRTAVLFTEHDMDVVFGHADRVVVMNRGRLIAEGAPADVRADPLVREVYLGGDTLSAANGTG